MSVKIAFLNGDLLEEVYIIPLQDVSYNQWEVCKLKKVIYSLKQAPRAWFEKTSTVITSFRFRPSDHNYALFVMSTSHVRIILSLYVDDMIIIGDDVDGINKLKLHLSKQFEMKDLDILHLFRD